MTAPVFFIFGLGTGLYVLFVLVALAVLALVAVALQYKKVGPNEVLIISGGKRQAITEPDGTVRTIGYRTHIGGGTFVMPFVEKAQILPIEMLTIHIDTPETYTAKGVPLMVEGSAQVRISTDDYSLRMAAEQFLSKGPEGIKRMASEIMGGFVRAMLGTMTVEEIYQDQKGFADRVIQTVAPDFRSMGLNIMSFSLTSIKDTQGFLEALGRPRIAQVKRDAAIAEAEAEKEASMKTASAKKEGEIARFRGETEIAEAHRDFETQKAVHEAAINENRAKADMAYDLQRHRMNQELKKEEYKVKIVEKQQAIVLGNHEIERMEKELDANVKKPAEARKFEAQLQAEADAFRLKQEAEARAEASRIEGKVQAELIEEQGRAEAEAMSKKAQAWEHYNQAALFEQFLDKLPELAEAVARPLSKVDKITLVNTGAEGTGTGASRVTGEVAKILAQMPEVIESLTGVDVKGFLGKPAQDKARAQEEETGAVKEGGAKSASSSKTKRKK